VLAGDPPDVGVGEGCASDDVGWSLPCSECGDDVDNQVVPGLLMGLLCAAVSPGAFGDEVERVLGRVHTRKSTATLLRSLGVTR
jgi:hypothetical protein